MPDNSLRTPGSGESVASDELTYSGDTAKVQVVRIGHVTGSEGAKTFREVLFAEDAAHTDGDFGLMMLGVRGHAGAGTDGDYGALSLTADAALRVEAERNLSRVSVQSAGLTIATTAYTAGDQVGTMFTFTGMARANGGSGTIVGVMMISAADITGGYDLALFRSNITLAGDNAAFAISDTDALEFAGLVQMSGAWDIGNNRVAQQFNLSVPYVCGSGTTSLFGTLITRSGHTFFGAVGDIQLILLTELN